MLARMTYVCMVLIVGGFLVTFACPIVLKSLAMIYSRERILRIDYVVLCEKCSHRISPLQIVVDIDVAKWLTHDRICCACRLQDPVLVVLVVGGHVG